MAANLRGLTEETAERAISQAVVGRLALSPDCVTDVLDAKKAMLKRSEMVEFVDLHRYVGQRWRTGREI